MDSLVDIKFMDIIAVEYGDDEAQLVYDMLWSVAIARRAEINRAEREGR